MDEGSAPEEQPDATPIFGAYRRGYDPEQVDRYVADQQRRLDETLHRATESERKLAAAVGQLRELHRRVAVLEAEERPTTIAQPLDTLGERVQRILQEAWDGAYALRETVEREVADQRAQAVEEAKELVASARRKAQAIEEEIDRRRRAYLERLEEDRARASEQIARLNDQRADAVAELVRVRDAIDATVGGSRGSVIVDVDLDHELDDVDDDDDFDDDFEDEDDTVQSRDADLPIASHPAASSIVGDDLPRTMPVRQFEGASAVQEDDGRASLVRSHRESVQFAPPAVARAASFERAEPPRSNIGRAQATVFDFEQA